MVEGLAKAYRLATALHVFVPISGYFPDPTLLIAGLVRDLKASTTRLMHKLGLGIRSEALQAETRVRVCLLLPLHRVRSCKQAKRHCTHTTHGRVWV